MLSLNHHCALMCFTCWSSVPGATSSAKRSSLRTAPCSEPLGSNMLQSFVSRIAENSRCNQRSTHVSSAKSLTDGVILQKSCLLLELAVRGDLGAIELLQHVENALEMHELCRPLGLPPSIAINGNHLVASLRAAVEAVSGQDHPP